MSGTIEPFGRQRIDREGGKGVRSFVLASVLFATTTLHVACAQSQPLVRAIASHLIMQTNDGVCDPTTCQIEYKLQCPDGYMASAYWVSLQYPFDVNVELTRDLIDSSKRAINRSALSSTGPLMGGGYSVL